MRLIRIAATLFVSATILLLIVRQRARRIAGYEAEGVTNDDVRAFVDNESQMVLIGLVIAALLILGAVALTIAAMIRSRRARLAGPARQPSPPRRDG